MGDGRPAANAAASRWAEKAYALLTLERRIVGVRFARTEAQYAALPGREMKAKIPYCVLVRSAMSGRTVKLHRRMSGCSGGGRALGFEEPGADFLTGERYARLGLYRDLETSRRTAAGMTLCRRPCCGVMVQPLEECRDEAPDVVILAADPLNAMRVLQGYTCVYGPAHDFRLTGNQALCVECTAHPFETGRMNLSLLCSGTRYHARWKPHEMALGMPYPRFEKTVAGLLQTADAVAQDAEKLRITQALVRLGFGDPGLTLGRTYYTALRREKKTEGKGPS